MSQHRVKVPEKDQVSFRKYFLQSIHKSLLLFYQNKHFASFVKVAMFWNYFSHPKLPSINVLFFLTRDRVPMTEKFESMLDKINSKQIKNTIPTFAKSIVREGITGLVFLGAP